MNRIAAVFEHCRTAERAALTLYATVGYPTLADSIEALKAMIAAGADMIELGVPFSAPMADGPVIQAAGQEALRQGVTLGDILSVAVAIRKESSVPLILFSYYNVLLRYGLEQLARDAAAAGIDGILVVDLPLEEQKELVQALEPAGLALIQLIAPTTPPDRAERILRHAFGFVYYITVKGVTGEQSVFPADLAGHLQRLRRQSPVPVVAGFGIATPEQAKMIAGHADGIVIGSAVVRRQKEPEKLREFVASMASALR